ncbi:MAG: helix-hairpin-helix domain-containing protein [Candidatus Omnitrophica bacterium]|nr:helix-hairpin-helix domain-containing protein [Candidatus Omnitrophota bacterium]
MNQQSIYRQPKQGSILVVCLWTIMILSILGLGITGLVFQEIKFSKTYFRLVTSLPLARGALKTIFYLKDKDLTPAYDTWDELSEEKKVSLCSNNAYRYFFVDKNGSEDNPEIIDESSLINLNLASVEVLARLPGMDEDLAEAIITSNLRPFSTINEVLLVEGITKESFLQFKDLVTVYGVGKVNINTVSKPVLVALGLDAEVADLLIRFRRENKITPLDTEPITDPPVTPTYGISNLGGLLNDLREYDDLGLRQEQDLLALLSIFEVKSEYQRFNIVTLPSGQDGMHYSIVIHLPSKKVLSWSEH